MGMTKVRPGNLAAKSFSDTTVYVPALVSKDPAQIQNSPVLRNRFLNDARRTADPVNRISNFLEQVRLGGDQAVNPG